MEHQCYETDILGTDGVSGKANSYPMTADVALKIGAAAGRYFRNDGSNGHRVVIGKNTRLSGYMFKKGVDSGAYQHRYECFTFRTSADASRWSSDDVPLCQGSCPLLYFL